MFQLLGRQASQRRAEEYRRDVAELNASKVLREEQSGLVARARERFTRSSGEPQQLAIVREIECLIDLLVETLGTALLSGDLRALEGGYLHDLPAAIATLQEMGVAPQAFGQLARTTLDEIRERFQSEPLQSKYVERMLQHVEKQLPA